MKTLSRFFEGNASDQVHYSVVLDHRSTHVRHERSACEDGAMGKISEPSAMPTWCDIHPGKVVPAKKLLRHPGILSDQVHCLLYSRRVSRGWRTHESSIPGLDTADRLTRSSSAEDSEETTESGECAEFYD